MSFDGFLKHLCKSFPYIGTSLTGVHYASGVQCHVCLETVIKSCYLNQLQTKTQQKNRLEYMGILESYSEMISGFVGFIFVVGCWWCNKNSPIMSLPLIGMLPALLWNLLWGPYSFVDYITSVLQRCGGTFVYRGPGLGGSGILFTCDPLNVRHILGNNGAKYLKGNDFRHLFEPLGDGIFNSSGDWWRTQRRMIHKMMNYGSLMPRIEMIVKRKTFQGLFCVLDRASEVRAQVDLQDVLQRCVFDFTCLTLFGYDPNCLSLGSPHNAHRKAFHDAEEAIFYRHIVPVGVWKLQKWLQLGAEKRMKKGLEINDSVLYQWISRKKEALDKSSYFIDMETEDFHLLGYLVAEEEDGVRGEGEGEEEEKGEKGEKGVLVKSSKFLRDTATNLLVAGSDTIAIGLSWLLWLVMTHLPVEKKILEELTQNYLQAEENELVPKFFRFEETSKLTYLHAAVLEALRLYPPVPLNHVDSVEPDIVPSGHHVDGNARIIYSVYSMARMKEIWGEDCLEFKPERWISEQGEIKRASPYKFAVFNAGPRSCLGKDLSLVEMKAVASSLIWNYRFQLAEDQVVRPSSSVLLHMRCGLKVMVTKRSSVP